MFVHSIGLTNRSRFIRLNKKQSILALVSILLISLLSLSTLLSIKNTNTTYAEAPPDSCFDFNPGTKTITSYYSNQNDDSGQPPCPKAVDIPSTIGGVEVKTIDTDAFREKLLTSVTIPDSVTLIGYRAFAYNELTSVIVPDSVTSIGDGAFSGGQLTSVTIPNSVTSIGSSAFSENQLTSVVIEGNNITSAGKNIFLLNPVISFTYNGTTYTTSDSITDDCYTFNSGTGTITDFNFADIDTVKNHNNACLSEHLNIPSAINSTAVTSIGSSAFSSNQLTSVTIPNSVTSIGNYAFSSNQLTSVTIPNSVTSIGYAAFSVNKLTSVYIGDGITSLDPSVFTRNFDYTEADMMDDLIELLKDYIVNGGDMDDPTPEFTQAHSVIVYKQYASAHIVPVYTIDPGNPNNLQDNVDFFTEEDEFGMDINDNGTTDDLLTNGGHIINPSSVVPVFKSSTGEVLIPPTGTPTVYTGYNSSTSSYITSYLAGDIPTGETDLSSYYRPGDTVDITITPPNIDGYITPDSQTLNGSLVLGANTVEFVYTPLDNGNDDDNNNDDGSNNTTALSYPNTTNTVSSNSNGSSTTPTVYLELPSSVNNGSVSEVAYSSLDTKDGSSVYPAGLTSFSYEVEAGSTTTVTLYYDLPGDPSIYIARKYNPSTKEYSTIENASITRVSYNNKSMIKLSYTLTDNGPLDLDNRLGYVLDPVGLATSQTDLDKALAKTGEGKTVVTIILAITALVITILASKVKLDKLGKA